MNVIKPSCTIIGATLCLFLLTNFSLYSQAIQTYVAEIECNNGSDHSTTLQNQSLLNHSDISSDTIILYPDTLYTNRKISFALVANFCEDLSIVLSDSEKGLLYGYRIIEDQVALVLDELVIEGPFHGVDSLGTIVSIPSNRNAIAAYNLEYNEGEFSFYLNDVLVLRSCIGIQGLNFEHILIPSSNTNATVSLTFESF